MNNNTKKLTVMAVLIALMIALIKVPFVFFIPLLFTCVTLSLSLTIIMSIIFGCISLGFAFMGGSVVAVAFMQAPWIPIIARLLTALGTYFIFNGVNLAIKNSKTFKNKKGANALPYYVAATSGSLLNTFLVVGSILLFAKNATFNEASMYSILPVIALYAVGELIANNLIVPPLGITFSKLNVFRDINKPKKIKVINKEDSINQNNNI